jgi:hypothetical protein
VNESFLKEQIERCRKLADVADSFIKPRLLILADRYEAHLHRLMHTPTTINAPIVFEGLPVTNCSSEIG